MSSPLYKTDLVERFGRFQLYRQEFRRRNLVIPINRYLVTLDEDLEIGSLEMEKAQFHDFLHFLHEWLDIQSTQINLARQRDGVDFEIYKGDPGKNWVTRFDLVHKALLEIEPDYIGDFSSMGNTLPLVDDHQIACDIEKDVDM